MMSHAGTRLPQCLSLFCFSHGFFITIISIMFAFPPYLVNTVVGQRLQRQLSAHNVPIYLPRDSLHVQPMPAPAPIPAYKFLADDTINHIIRYKLVHKLGVVGILGTDPKPPHEFSDQELFDVFNQFKDQLLADPGHASGKSGSGAGDDGEEAVDDDTADSGQSGTGTGSGLNGRKPVLDLVRAGEVVMPAPPDFPPHYRPYLSHSLKDLLLISKLESKSPTTSKPNLVRFGDGTCFDYPLPALWLSLVPTDVDVDVECGDGIVARTRPTHSTTTTTATTDTTATSSDGYLNFITNNPVDPNTGVFYYEVNVTQKATPATDFIPLLKIKDAAVSSHRAPQLGVGFTKRYINYDHRGSGSASGLPPPAPGDTSGSRAGGPRSRVGSVPTAPPPPGVNIGLGSGALDLESIKNDLIFHQDNLIHRPLKHGMSDLLTTKPGEFRGSFAVDLGDLMFYNSIKSSESAQRNSILSMNRRLSSLTRQNLTELDAGKIDMGADFGTTVNDDDKQGCKVFTSDVIGFGINFIESSLFITLNGVLIKTISRDELMATNPLNDNLFSKSSHIDDSVYPMIGFQLNKLTCKHNYPPTELYINTNLGFSEFEFNIDNYIKWFKQYTDNKLYMTIKDKFQHHKQDDNDDDNDNENSLERQLLNVDEDSKLLNKLIKEYLNIQGYIDTFTALEGDISDLQHTVPLMDNIEIDEDVIAKSHGNKRQMVFESLKQGQFDSVLQIIEDYGNGFSNKEGEAIIFKVKMCKLIQELKQYHESFGNQTYQQRIVELIKQLLNCYGDDKDKVDEINTISIMLVTKDITNLIKLQEILDNFDETIKILGHQVNGKILESLGFKAKSNLEMIFEAVDDNIRDLGLNERDERFGLVNFDREIG